MKTSWTLGRVNVSFGTNLNMIQSIVSKDDLTTERIDILVSSYLDRFNKKTLNELCQSTDYLSSLLSNEGINFMRSCILDMLAENIISNYDEYASSTKDDVITLSHFTTMLSISNMNGKKIKEVLVPVIMLDTGMMNPNNLGGLYCSDFPFILLDTTGRNENLPTLAHEMYHSIIHALRVSGLDAEMYGGDESPDQREEIIVHLLTDYPELISAMDSIQRSFKFKRDEDGNVNQLSFFNHVINDSRNNQSQQADKSSTIQKANYVNATVLKGSKIAFQAKSHKSNQSSRNVRFINDNIKNYREGVHIHNYTTEIIKSHYKDDPNNNRVNVSYNSLSFRNIIQALCLQKINYKNKRRK